jgi:hypothetical protein
MDKNWIQHENVTLITNFVFILILILIVVVLVTGTDVFYHFILKTKKVS